MVKNMIMKLMHLMDKLYNMIMIWSIIIFQTIIQQIIKVM